MEDSEDDNDVFAEAIFAWIVRKDIKQIHVCLRKSKNTKNMKIKGNDTKEIEIIFENHDMVLNTMTSSSSSNNGWKHNTEKKRRTKSDENGNCINKIIWNDVNLKI